MASDVIEAVLHFGALIFGLTVLYLGWQGYKLSSRARDLPKGSTFSESANPALNDHGIFIDHGMVSSLTGKTKAQYKRSRAYYEAITRN